MSDKLEIINNAFDGKISANHYSNKQKKEVYKIGYIGTIDYWFDFESLEYTLNNFENIEYHLIGPYTEDINVKCENSRIKCYGAVNHDEINDLVKNWDCLIMPFNLNKIVQSVDPVKLYEYLNFNKPIISVYYPELEKFRPFIYFYSDKSELSDLLKEMLDFGLEKQYSNDQRLNFLKENTWKARVKLMVELIEKDK